MAGRSPRYLPHSRPAVFPPVPCGREGLPELGGVYICLGPPRHGKSSVILNMLEAYRDDLATVFVLSPNARTDATFAPVLDIAASAHPDDPEIVVKTTFDEQDFEAYEKAIREAPPTYGGFHMLVLDDVINAIPQHSRVWGMLSRWAHLGLTVLIGTQKLRGALPKVARQMASCYLLLGCAQSEHKELDEELAPFPATTALAAAKKRHGHFGWVRYMPYHGLAWEAPGSEFDTRREALVFEQNKGDYDEWAAALAKRSTSQKPAA